MANTFIDEVALTSVAVVQVEEFEVISESSVGPPGMRGEKGEKGEDGSSAALSTDPNNRSVEGTDGGIFTPDLVVDPLAYYILAKS